MYNFWHFLVSPLKMKTWPDWGTLDLSWSGVPHKDLCGSWCETNCCIPQGFHLIRLVDRILSIGWKYLFCVHKVSICYGLHWQVMGAKRSPHRQLTPHSPMQPLYLNGGGDPDSHPCSRFTWMVVGTHTANLAHAVSCSPTQSLYLNDGGDLHSHLHNPHGSTSIHPHMQPLQWIVVKTQTAIYVAAMWPLYFEW